MRWVLIYCTGHAAPNSLQLPIRSLYFHVAGCAALRRRPRPGLRHRHRRRCPRPRLHHPSRLLPMHPRQGQPPTPSSLHAPGLPVRRRGGSSWARRDRSRGLLPQVRLRGHSSGWALPDLLGGVRGRRGAPPSAGVWALLPRGVHRRVAAGQRHVSALPQLSGGVRGGDSGGDSAIRADSFGSAPTVTGISDGCVCVDLRTVRVVKHH